MSVRNQAKERVRDDGTSPFETTWPWRGGAVAGLLATVVTGIVISAMQLSTLQVAIAGLYGQSGSLVAGWVAHLVHGTLFGMLFALLLSDPGLYRLTDWYWKTILAGVVYGLVLAVVGAGILMPIWLDVVGGATPLSIPNVTVPMLLWHVTYGLVLGGAFAVVERRSE
ncbi:hypothetical protein [Halogeometricum limi]|uniref:Histidine kinase n=1 Tax=Halogeometricum limi TaxID=555875 RepID=A0A1I6ICU3_9EURY|nr:hypothetical protein [Halogeometricum limi]SFR64444.1 hypothetical protein SAMN04488124_3044 [Halogeometricum limi]